MSKFAKAIGAALGGVTGVAVAAALGWFDVEVSAELAGAIAIILSTFGTYIAPKNAEPFDGVGPDL